MAVSAIAAGAIDDGGTRRRLERRVVGKRRPPLGRGGREDIQQEQRRAEHDREDESPEQNPAHGGMLVQDHTACQ